jgi:hypothetical protein
MTNVIPLFGYKVSPAPPRTHFVGLGMTTMCGEQATAYLDKDTVPECERCVRAWTNATGWSFPLPPIGCTD